jgi:hypothetical protein
VDLGCTAAVEASCADADADAVGSSSGLLEVDMETDGYSEAVVRSE